MKTKIEIYSSKKIKNFFINLDSFFNLNLKGFDELESSFDSKNLSIVFFDNQDCLGEKIVNKTLLNENFIFVHKELSIFEKTSLDLKKNLMAPLSISKFLDTINEFLNKKKVIHRNIELNRNLITNTKTKEKNYLTHVESLILLKLFNEKNVNKELLERDVLDIKQNLITSSIESHLNRIRKKLKIIESEFSVFSRNNNIFLR